MLRLWVLVLLLAALPGAEASAGKPRPDLLVRGGTVTQAGTTITGSATVKAKGPVRARRSVAEVRVVAAGQEVVVQRVVVRAIRPGRTRTVQVAASLPTGLPPGPAQVRVCADADDRVRERNEKNNCRTVGTVVVPPAPGPVPEPSSVPADPIPFTADEKFHVQDSGGDYWAFVPASYDATHATPTVLYVWLHGCGGASEYDIWTVSPGGADQDYIAIAPGGREVQCWDMETDPALVLAAVADVRTHFNIAPRRVVIGGYSSGGDLAYRTAFQHARSFAGVVVSDTSPFQATGWSQAQSLAAASWRFNVVHLAHLQDDVYPIERVRAETEAMRQAGFPVTRIEVEGPHYSSPGTDAGIRTHLLPVLRAGWVSPG